MNPAKGDQGKAAVSGLFRAGRRRRPPSPQEQARRVAWGKKWGAILAAHAKTYERRG